MVNWISFFEKDPSLCWVMQWWHMQLFVIGKEVLARVHLIGLCSRTYYFLSRIMRQIGHIQCIPALDCIVPRTYQNDPFRIKA